MLKAGARSTLLCGCIFVFAAGGCPLQATLDGGLDAKTAQDRVATGATPAEAVALADDPNAVDAGTPDASSEDTAMTDATALLEQLITGGESGLTIDEILALAEKLGLDAPQQDQTAGIVDSLGIGRSAVRRAAVQAIRAAFTDAQRQMLDQVATEVLDQAGVPADQRAWVSPTLDLLAAKLGLQPAQRLEIDVIRVLAQQQMDALQQKAKDEFLSLLTGWQASLAARLSGI